MERAVDAACAGAVRAQVLLCVSSPTQSEPRAAGRRARVGRVVAAAALPARQRRQPARDAAATAQAPAAGARQETVGRHVGVMHDRLDSCSR